MKCTEKYFENLFIEILERMTQLKYKSEEKQDNLISRFLDYAINIAQSGLDDKIIDMELQYEITRICMRKDIDDEVKELMKETAQLELNVDQLIHEEEVLKQRYASYNDEFKKIIIHSDKSKMLTSYKRYKEWESKMQESDNVSEPTSESSIIEIWVEQTSRKINESNFAQSEAKLIEEAKESHLFDKEYKVFDDIQFRLNEIDADLYNNRKILKEKEDLIDSLKGKLEKLNEYLEALKEIYPDIE